MVRRAQRDVAVHPTTHLPGTVQIERDIGERLARNEDFAVCYADLDNFKEMGYCLKCHRPLHVVVMAVPASQLRGGVDYPRTRLELDEFFPDDAACLEYVEGLRWPEGFVCVGCGGLGEVWRASRGRLVCPHCRRQTSVLAGTVFHRTRSPLRLWFLAA